MRIDTEGFLYNYKNIVLPMFVNINNSPVGVTANGPKARLYGLDLDIVGQITDRLQVSASAEGLHSEFTSFPAGNYYNPNPNGGAADLIRNLTGNQMPAAPKITTDLTATYLLPTKVGHIGVSADWSYNSGWFDGPDNVFKQKAFDMISARLTWNPWDSSWRVAFWGHNLKDEVVFARSSSSAPFGYLATLQAPRTYGVNVEYSFGSPR